MPRPRRSKRPAVSAQSQVLSFLSRLHWGVLLTLSVMAFLGVHAYAATQPLPSLQSQGLPVESFWNAISWIAGGFFLVLTVVSFFRARARRRLLDDNTTLAQIQAMDWRAFERLVGEAYRRQGYAVKETGQGGADGGVDLLLRRDGKITLVQCKQWRSRSIGAPTVREMWGLAHHHGASAVKIVGVGDFTPAARAFARGKPLDLVSGEHLVSLIQSVTKAADLPMPVAAALDRPLRQLSDTPSCPHCQAVMLSRVSRKKNGSFWGCSRYPLCRGTRP